MKLEPIEKDRLWGSESWKLCCHTQGMSRIANGRLQGLSLQEILRQYGKAVMGARRYAAGAAFPLMIKILDAKEALSIQVHPDDEFARAKEGEPGKTEAWYVLQAAEGAKIVYGLQGSDQRDFWQNAVQQGRWDEVLRTVSVKAGDMIMVPAGTVHALLAGVVVYEVQQNSDSTYRLYDFNRVDAQGKSRELHTDKALAVINFAVQPSVDFMQQQLVCEHFMLEKQFIENYALVQTGDQFIIYCILKGCGELVYEQGKEVVTVGETILIPAALGKFSFTGNLEVLKITEPK